MRGPSLVMAGVCALVLLMLTETSASAQDEPVKPYIVFIMDVSGSMVNNSTGNGPPSCGGQDTLLDHAKCALSNITNTYGDVVIALGRFRQSQNTGDTNCGNGCSESGVDCDQCYTDRNNTGSGSCTTGMAGGDRFELLVPLVNDNQNDIINWVDLTCGTCSLDSSLNPELQANGWTPLAGSLRGAQRYMQGLTTPGTDSGVGTVPYWTGPGDDPIRDDPLKTIFPPTDPDGAQCRPYIVILLTDGAETCTYFDDTVTSYSPEPGNAAQSLLTTTVDGLTYRIETKPIGFGIAGPSAEIEDIATRGGGANGYYAADEVSLSQALADIISDSLKFETCNDLDDDCDLLIDEDFPLKGTTCDNGLLGVCHSDGVFQCTGDGSGLECVLDNPGHPTPGSITEICNQLDDDCDGKVDEAPADCTGCLPFELCDGLDNDCDTRFDEGDLTRTCGTDVGICEPGTQTCVEQGSMNPSGGTWTPCNDTPPNPPEICNSLDDDCDGTVDGLTEQCWTSPANDPPWVGACGPGTRVCPTDGSGWTACIGERTPAATDPCDGSDNDCDGTTDEDFTPSDCSSTCGMGQTYCDMGTVRCDASDTPMDEICNAYDDDCDGVVDEDVPDMGDCYDDGRCDPGTLVCDASTGGQFECRGGTLPGIEICDCEDNDCDGNIDEENPDPLCAPGASCVECQCAFPCETGEFPCPVGRVCDMDFCLIDTCYGITCAPDANGDQTECVDGECVRSCDLVTCPTNYVCDGPDGTCKPDNCISFPDKCDANQFCVNGTCVPDPCEGVTCSGPGEYCRGGNCVTSCAGVECPDGQRCELGQCTDHPCGRNCPAGQVCDEDDGECKNDPCEFVQCPTGQACDPNNGSCGDDPCLGVTCPGAGQVCVDGSCYNPGDLEPPVVGPDPEYVAPGGGGGCSSSGGSGGGAMVLALLALLGVVRRRGVA